ncbi:MAG: YihY/virulence factor BrkB family protein [Bacteroidales bacterium]|nr:YihY/virulence factor BrkB family protein [Bacteroidales bacterium]HOL99088.1 YihY/virulence factor BrkB family protein [Bacteroidales bacterium]HOM37328.1 YihY/virulence factor BrkB family protein [Bacteroidales bacterium]HPD24884.1 YihY/virulence factor BrkB family protein [Bacteroidales bacterium]HRT00595.1 YihY/virulence factor BrkB family protein [Bacteroidales bacterium]
MINRVKQIIQKINNHIFRISDKIILPGFKGLSLYELGKIFFKGISNGNLTMRASSVAFSTFIAIFPAMIFLFSLIPFIPIEDFHMELFSLLADVLPGNAYDLLHETITDTIMNQRTSVLSVGFFLTIFFASNGIISLVEAFNSSYHSIETRGIIAVRVLSLILLFVLVLIFIISISLISIGDDFFVKFFIDHPKLGEYQFLRFTIRVLRYFIVLVLYFLGIAIMYYYAPAKNTGFRFLSPGAVMATFLQVIGVLLFTYYVNNFSQYNKLYGSIGTIIVIMMLIYVSALALILGFELNAAIYYGKRK